MTTTIAKNSTEEAPAAAEDGLFWESKVAKTLGLARDRIRELREQHLEEGADWRTRGNAVVLTARGLEKITALAQGETPAAPAPVKAGPPEVARLVVARLCGNHRLLHARRRDAGPEAVALLVRVKTNEHFMAGMEFDAIACGDGTFQFTGRLPRRKGRW